MATLRDWDDVNDAHSHFMMCTEADPCGTCDDFWTHRNNCVIMTCPCHYPFPAPRANRRKAS